jgi:hypothetical protein
MKILYTLTTIFLSLVINYSGFAQPTPTWVRRYNAINVSDEIRAMRVVNGFVYVTGPSDGAKKGNIDFATIKYDTAGNQIWVARYNGPGNGEDWPNAIAVDAAGNVYVTGRSTGTGTNEDYATVKYDAAGNQKWVARYNSPGNRNDNAKAIAIDANGNVIVTGETDDVYVIGSANSATTIKYDSSNGQQINIDIYDALPNIYSGTNTNGEEANSVAVDPNGNIYVGGNSAGGLIIQYDNSLHRNWIKNISGGDVHKVSVDASNNVAITGFNGQTFKYNSSGDLIWQANVSGVGFWDMTLDAAGNVYVTGEGSDYLTAKYSASDGHMLWSNAYSGSGNSSDFARSIAVDGSGNVYVTGHCTVKSGKNGLVCAGTIKYNNAGVQQWAAMYDSTNKLTSDGFIVATDVNGNVYVGGQGISSTTSSNYDFLTIKYSNGSTGFITRRSANVAENNIALFTLKNYPNPFLNNTIIEYQIPHDGKVKLAIYDLSGKEITTLVNETKTTGIYKINFESSKLSSGTYVCKIQFGDLNKTKELVVVK